MDEGSFAHDMPRIRSYSMRGKDVMANMIGEQKVEQMQWVH
ncbi:MAG TPA: hypothetical protein QKA14_03150 [Candidatus Megaira endosymbiont of Hartmannula sinica]|nr:hypothetical protein [Candidatus Megaera endosymbiont of Hartmannula sinica]